MSQDDAARPAPAANPVTDERQRELQRLDRLAHVLDAQFRVPGTGFRIGLDGLVGLIPGLGDTLTFLPSAYVVLRGYQLGARRRTLLRIAGNTGIDYLVGAIPVVGDIFDVYFKNNLRNVALLKAEFGDDADC